MVAWHVGQILFRIQGRVLYIVELFRNVWYGKVYEFSSQFKSYFQLHLQSSINFLLTSSIVIFLAWTLLYQTTVVVDSGTCWPSPIRLDIHSTAYLYVDTCCSALSHPLVAAVGILIFWLESPDPNAQWAKSRILVLSQYSPHWNWKCARLRVEAHTPANHLIYHLSRNALLGDKQLQKSLSP